MVQTYSDIETLLKQAKETPTSPRLQLYSPTLTPPDTPLIRTLTGHSSSVSSVVVTPDGKTVISGSRDNTLKVWELETGNCIATFIADYPILCCAVASDGVTIIVGDSGGMVHFLNYKL